MVFILNKIMKIVITEDQYKLILEQKSDYAMDRQSNAILHSTGIRNQKDYNTVNSVTKKASDSKLNINKHTAMTILQIGTAFIPLIGPFISAGIGLVDAAMYYNEGDKKTAGLVGVFSMLPGVGGLASKMGLGKWSAKSLGKIGKKISFGSKLTPIESKVANRVAKHKQLIQTEMNKIGKDATIQSGKNAVKKKITKSNVIKGTKKVGSELGTYAAVGYGYDKGYDKITGQKEVDFVSIDSNKVSQANKTAALSIKF
jgi:hypothetical protein